jgi:hypothetical protein
MRTDDLRPSSNVEDDREASASRGVPGGAGGPFAELVQLSPTSIADEMREEHCRQVLGE